MAKDKKHKRLKNGLLPVIAIILVSSSVCLVLYNTWDDWRAGADTAAERNRVIQYLPDPEEEANDPTEIKYSGSDNITDMPTENVQGTDFAAVLSIPALELELPVRDQWSYPGLRRSPCRYKGSAYTDDLVICAHNYNAHFGRIKELAKKDEVIVVAMNGDVFRYQVEEVTALSPYAYQEMTDSAYDLTLFTCTVGGAQRVTVRCGLVNFQPHSPHLIQSQHMFF